MSDRSGCTAVELAVLEALDAATSGRPRAYARSARVLAGIEERIGLGPRYAYEALLDLARAWIIPVRTVAVMGNAGDRYFSPAAGPGYTESRTSYAGQLALDAEAGRLAPVPLGLINGTTYRGGTQPPLEPFRVLAALRRLLEDPGVPDAEVISILGPPYSMTGCAVTGDIPALLRGRRVVLRETARITVTGVPVPEAPAHPPPAPTGYRVMAASGGLGRRPPRPPGYRVPAFQDHGVRRAARDPQPGGLPAVGGLPSRPGPQNEAAGRGHRRGHQGRGDPDSRHAPAGLRPRDGTGPARGNRGGFGRDRMCVSGPASRTPAFLGRAVPSGRSRGQPGRAGERHPPRPAA